jgi:hypothetical protein
MKTDIEDIVWDNAFFFFHFCVPDHNQKGLHSQMAKVLIWENCKINGGKSF